MPFWVLKGMAIEGYHDTHSVEGCQSGTGAEDRVLGLPPLCRRGVCDIASREGLFKAVCQAKSLFLEFHLFTNSVARSSNKANALSNQASIS
jgi:hypothetical protein